MFWCFLLPNHKTTKFHSFSSYLQKPSLHKESFWSSCPPITHKRHKEEECVLVLKMVCFVLRSKDSVMDLHVFVLIFQKVNTHQNPLYFRIVT